MRKDVQAKRLSAPDARRRAYDIVEAAPLRARRSSCWSRPTDIIPADGEVIEGVASVNESAVTGESAPVLREAGGDFSSVTGGTRVLSDWLVVRVTQPRGRGIPRSHDRDGRGRKARHDAERDRALDPARDA